MYYRTNRKEDYSLLYRTSDKNVFADSLDKINLLLAGKVLYLN
jgi:hypothetical protein